MKENGIPPEAILVRKTRKVKRPEKAASGMPMRYERSVPNL
jgi:hypothetical protein